MAAPQHFRPADLGGDPTEIECRPGFREVEIRWTKPEPWGPGDEEAPIGKAQMKPGYLYAISWDHHLAHRSETIAYIGITSKLDTRFSNHPTADHIRQRKRKTFLSIGHIDFGRLQNASPRTRRITEELEHILIWAMWPDLENICKQITIPGFGRTRGGAWHIVNRGHRFRGRMPREIVFPWMIVKPGRDTSLKR